MDGLIESCLRCGSKIIPPSSAGRVRVYCTDCSSLTAFDFERIRENKRHCEALGLIDIKEKLSKGEAA